jgi:hypothetical protein
VFVFVFPKESLVSLRFLRVGEPGKIILSVMFFVSVICPSKNVIFPRKSLVFCGFLWKSLVFLSSPLEKLGFPLVFRFWGAGEN